MTGKRIWRLVFALAVIAGLTVGGIALYRMGFAHGAMTTITLPEGSEFPTMPFGHRPYGWHFGPRVGLLGIFPLLCFGSFFFLALLFGFGFFARKRAWMHHYGPGSPPEHWKHYGPPPWWQDQAKDESDTPSSDNKESEA